jgi:hypothetical protein
MKPIITELANYARTAWPMTIHELQDIPVVTEEEVHACGCVVHRKDVDGSLRTAQSVLCGFHAGERPDCAHRITLFATRCS